MKCEYGYDCYYRVGEVCKFVDFSPCEEPMACTERREKESLVPVADAHEQERYKPGTKILFCSRCEKHLANIVWRYVQPVDDFAVWSEEGQHYEYDDSTDKGQLDCITLCPECGMKLKDFGYNGQYEPITPEEEPAPGKKTYVAKFTIFEGEHEHHGAFLVHAASEEEASALAKTQEHGQEYPEDEEDEKDEDAELTYWDYGDATTAARFEQIAEITVAEAATLRRLGLAYDFND